jgi:hypothetical protein
MTSLSHLVVASVREIFFYLMSKLIFLLLQSNELILMQRKDNLLK